MVDKQTDEVDQLLDRVLAGYTVPSSPGLDSRVVRHVVGSELKRRRCKVYLVGSLVLAASLSVLLVRPTPAPVRPKIYTTALRVKADQKGLSQPVTHGFVRRKRIYRTQLPPNVNVFLSPMPMTSEERALVRFVEQSPAAAEKSFAGLHEHDTEPLRIEALKIVPLVDESLNSGGKP